MLPTAGFFRHDELSRDVSSGSESTSKLSPQLLPWSAKHTVCAVSASPSCGSPMRSWSRVGVFPQSSLGWDVFSMLGSGAMIPVVMRCRWATLSLFFPPFPRVGFGSRLVHSWLECCAAEWAVGQSSWIGVDITCVVFSILNIPFCQSVPEFSVTQTSLHIPKQCTNHNRLTASVSKSWDGWICRRSRISVGRA